MGVNAENINIFMKLPTLIQRSCFLKDNEPSHLPTIVGKKSEMTLLGFINLGLNEQEAHDFSKDFLRDCATCVSPKTRGKYVDSTHPLPEILLAQHGVIVEHSYGETWTLTHYPLLLLFWSTSFQPEGERCNSCMLRLHMYQCHPLSLLYVNCVSDCIYQLDYYNKSFLETFRHSPGEQKNAVSVQRRSHAFPTNLYFLK